MKKIILKTWEKLLYSHDGPKNLLPWSLALAALLAAQGLRSEIGATEILFWGVSGMVTWTLMEYLLHRFAFHYTPRAKWARAWVNRAHINHHRNMNDPRIVTASPLVVLASNALYATLALALGAGAGLWFFLVGLVLAHWGYEWTHYSAHFGPEPGTSILGQYRAWVRAHHLRHHEVNWMRDFGVTTTLWDGVFGSGSIPKREN